MLLLESFIHRQTLAEIISRWMVNRPRVGDVARLKRIVNFNLYMMRVWLNALTTDLVKTLHGTTALRQTVSLKGQIKDFAVEHLTYTNSRIGELCARYRKYPEDFYQATPIDGAMYVIDTGAGLRFVASTRVKRFRRIAEKGSRRIVDSILANIRANADSLAEERARMRGIPKNQLVTPLAEQAAEFAHAERRVIKGLKHGILHTEPPLLAIPDVAGIKLIVEEEEHQRLVSAIEASIPAKVVEVERHKGNYNAVNIKLAYKVPRQLLYTHPPTGRYLHVLQYRGLDPAWIPREYESFLDNAEEDILVEIIVVNFQEFLESEIGRCMHEERVLSQRANADYNGFLATNVRYLMDYILTICRAPGLAEVEDVPIKLWIKYMPETIEQISQLLFVPNNVFFDSVPGLPTPRNDSIPAS